ncbi:interferon alpha/beta receptor 1a-like [Alosa sapidissima]|uniref:interferon alpha/beta receptor 1a-like n=1 Tax=Alosa sapidissima TaxID=34773 RepID=UPI001C093373|nr:interferon alpha/beta receptor 1a-like [Alosa sapidissima]
MQTGRLAALAAVFSLSACVWLQPPSEVRMEAINTRYTLHWHWTPQGHTHTTCFTVQYKYSHQRVWNRSVCEGVCVQSCDLSTRLHFSGSYWLRVRAEYGGQRSNWSHHLKFTPEEDTLLGQPSILEVQGGVSTVTVRMGELLTHEAMSHLMADLTYRVQYWEKYTPEQWSEEDSDIPLLTLQDLKPHTEYCLRVCVFSSNYDKTSNYTHAQCTQTHSRRPVWQVTVGVCLVVCVLVLLTLTHLLRKKPKKSPKYTPSSLQGPPLSHLSLLHVGLEPCSQVAVETLVTVATVEVLRERGGEEAGPGEEAGRGEERRRCVCEDSGVYSGEDSSDSSISTSSQHHTHTHTHTLRPEERRAGRKTLELTDMD